MLAAAVVLWAGSTYKARAKTGLCAINAGQLVKCGKNVFRRGVHTSMVRVVGGGDLAGLKVGTKVACTWSQRRFLGVSLWHRGGTHVCAARA